MKDYRVLLNQSLLDVCMQHYGSLAGLQMLIDDNTDRVPGLHFASYIEPGTVLRIRTGFIEGLPTNVRDEFARRGLVVATGNPKPTGLCAMRLCVDFRLKCEHPDTPPEGISVWGINQDFTVTP